MKITTLRGGIWLPGQRRCRSYGGNHTSWARYDGVAEGDTLMNAYLFTPLYTRHMLGVIEAERMRRKRR
jgi:hypothetical protein